LLLLLSLLLLLCFIYLTRRWWCVSVDAAADFIMGVYLLLIGSTDVVYRDQYNRYALSWMDSWCCQTAGFLAVLSCEAWVQHLYKP